MRHEITKYKRRVNNVKQCLFLEYGYRLKLIYSVIFIHNCLELCSLYSERGNLGLLKKEGGCIGQKLQFGAQNGSDVDQKRKKLQKEQEQQKLLALIDRDYREKLLHF